MTHDTRTLILQCLVSCRKSPAKKAIQGHSGSFNVIPVNRNNSDGKASLTRQKSPETTTDTHDVSNFY